MAKFIIGLIIGVVVGVLAMAANPDLPQQLRVTLADLTATVMRSAEDTAEQLGDAAEDLADGPAPAHETPPAATPQAAPVAPSDGGGTGQSL